VTRAAAALLCLAFIAQAERRIRDRDFITPRPAPAGSIIVIGFLGAWEDWDNPKRSVRKVALRLRERHIPGFYVETAGNHSRATVLKFLKRAVGRNRSDAGIILYGQSFGGAAVVKLARELNHMQVPVLLTIQIDSIGRDDAPVTMVEFTDYQCPFCRKYHTETFAELKKNYIDTGKVRFISRDLPLDFHPNAQRAAEAARCAGDQKKFWELRDRMIANSADLSQDAILKMAQSDSLEMTSFRACLDGNKHKAEIQKDAADASALGISGTPSFVIGKTSKDTLDGDRVVGAVPASVFEAEFKKFLPATP
jgi:protein-disulfide isomerase